MARHLTLKTYYDVLELGKQLCRTFPKCFFPIGQEKPLKVGIFHDLVQKLDELITKPGKRIIHTFMAIYINSIFYYI